MKAMASVAGLALALLAASTTVAAQSLYQSELQPRAQSAVQSENWVPVVLLPTVRPQPFPASALTGLPDDGVLLGFLNVSEVQAPLFATNISRVQAAGQVPVLDRLRLRGMIAASEFKPCVGLMEQPELAPLRPDLCENFGPGSNNGKTTAAGLGAELKLDKGWIGVSVNHVEGQDLSLALPNPIVASTELQPMPPPMGLDATKDLGLSPLLAPFSSDSVNLQAVLELDSDSQIGLGMALARAQIDIASQSTPVLLDQGTLSFSVQQGNLTAQLGTRVIDLPDVQGFLPWAGLDLEVSWRLPWQGIISVGAQNVVSKGTPPPLLDPTAEDTTESFSRVPYVRYHQDL